MLPFLVVAASLLAIPVSWVLLRIYARSVRRGMTTGRQAPTDVVPRGVPSGQLRLDEMLRNGPADTGDHALPEFRMAMAGRWQSAAIYASAGACFALVMTVGLFLSDRTQSVVATKVGLLFWSYFWPVVPATCLIAAYDRRRRMQIVGGYFLVLGAIFLVAIIRNPGVGLGQLPLYWIITNGPPSILIVAFLYRPIRAVGPLVLVFLIALAVGSQLLLSIAGRNDRVLRTISNAGYSIGLGATSTFVLMIVIGMIVFGALVGWPMLRMLGRRYGHKKLSDQSLLLDALWLIFALVYSIDLVFNGTPWILTGAVAFVAYKLVVVQGFRLRTRRLQSAPPKTLLLLRVFALGKRSERLFSKLRKHWQYVGSICMIAGPDLATSTVEPHEFLEFVRGRTARQFIGGSTELEQRMSSFDRLPDPDGRFRITEFFCHNDTWQMTMERLAQSSDTILMDLRSFSQSNRGCSIELGRLLDTINLTRVLFLVDNTTDRKFLESTLQDLWRNLAADSPNRVQQDCAARIFTVSSQDEGELGVLVGRLLGSA
jgi:hypothetical protein